MNRITVVRPYYPGVDRSNVPAMHAPPESETDVADEPGTMRELIRNRGWRGTKIKAEIDAQIAGERTGWHEL